jgi:predicted Zn-dependent protease
MIASTKKGILVTRFHYTNMVDPVKTIITGMTRDGTFLIEDGEITRPVKNMRFTQSILEALNSTEAVGKDLHIAGEYFIYPTLVPALKLGNFHFTGVTR